MSRSVRINSTHGVVALVICGLLLPSSAGAASSFCSPSGDFCIRIARDGGSPVFSIGTFAHRGRYTLCVTAPDSSRVCKRSLLTPEVHDLFGSHVRWSRQFPTRARASTACDGGRAGRISDPGCPSAQDRQCIFGPDRSRRAAPCASSAQRRGAPRGISSSCSRRRSLAATSRRSAGRVHPRACRRPLPPRIRIPRGRRPGDYVISGRCGGGNLGIRGRSGSVSRQELVRLLRDAGSWPGTITSGSSRIWRLATKMIRNLAGSP